VFRQLEVPEGATVGSLYGLFDLKNPLEFAPSEPLTMERLQSGWRDYQRTMEANRNRPEPPLFVTPQQYADLKAAGYLRPKPIDGEQQVERQRNRRKLKIAKRMLKRAKTPGQRAMAAASIRMLEEMVK
jgi:hypothetical protein